MSKVYVRELESYSEDYLRDLFHVNKDGFKNIIYKLSSYNLIKKSSYNIYQFKKFVGVIVIGDLIINCYPKYLPNITRENIDIIEDKFKEVMKVIRKHHKISNFSYEFNETDIISSNLISLRLFFLEDYYENGIYTNIKNILETNGNGEINWNRTINDSLAIIKNKKPFYTELQTRYKLNDTNDFFHRLHECIITDSSEQLENSELIELFGLTPIELSEKSCNEYIEDYGEDIISEKLSKEVKVEFNTHKQNLLRLMKNYIENINRFNEDDDLDLYGTSSFHTIWEDVCKKVFGDKLNKQLSILENELPKRLNKFSNKKDEKLISLIDKPIWNINKHKDIAYNLEEEDENGIKKNTLVPDLIVFNKKTFIIFDAKYYVYDYDESKNKIYHQPDIGSITKQYLYELAYEDFLKDVGFENTKNGFLFPSTEEDIKNNGFVKLKFLSKILKDKNEIFKNKENIQIIMLPASLMYKYYLNNELIEDYSFLK